MEMNIPIQPINLRPEQTQTDEKLTAVEMAKLWATYVGNSMSNKILHYFLQHVKDEEIKKLVENGFILTQDFMKRIEEILKKDNFPIPKGFTEDDVNLNAPRLFEEEFFVHYLKYAAKAGLSIYAVAIPLVMREDVKEFFIYCNTCTIVLINQINDVLMVKGMIIKPPILPVPEKVDFVKDQNFLKGFLGDVRPLHALEVTHLYDNIENNVTSKALILGFSQVVRNEKVKQLFIRGTEMTDKAVLRYKEKLHKENLPSPSLLDHLVTESKIPPFSDKLMLFHKVDMFSMKMRAFGNSLAVNGRRDIGMLYTRSLKNIFLFVDDGANILIENGWMEQPPKAADRENLV